MPTSDEPTDGQKLGLTLSMVATDPTATCLLAGKLLNELIKKKPEDFDPDMMDVLVRENKTIQGIFIVAGLQCLLDAQALLARAHLEMGNELLPKSKTPNKG